MSEKASRMWAAASEQLNMLRGQMSGLAKDAAEKKAAIEGGRLKRLDSMWTLMNSPDITPEGRKAFAENVSKEFGSLFGLNVDPKTFVGVHKQLGEKTKRLMNIGYGPNDAGFDDDMREGMELASLIDKTNPQAGMTYRQSVLAWRGKIKKFSGQSEEDLATMEDIAKMPGMRADIVMPKRGSEAPLLAATSTAPGTEQELVKMATTLALSQIENATKNLEKGQTLPPDYIDKASVAAVDAAMRMKGTLPGMISQKQPFAIASGSTSTPASTAARPGRMTSPAAPATTTGREFPTSAELQSRPEPMTPAGFPRFEDEEPEPMMTPAGAPMSVGPTAGPGLEGPTVPVPEVIRPQIISVIKAAKQVPDIGEAFGKTLAAMPDEFGATQGGINMAATSKNSVIKWFGMKGRQVMGKPENPPGSIVALRAKTQAVGKEIAAALERAGRLTDLDYQVGLMQMPDFMDRENFFGSLAATTAMSRDNAEALLTYAKGERWPTPVIKELQDVVTKLEGQNAIYQGIMEAQDFGTWDPKMANALAERIYPAMTKLKESLQGREPTPSEVIAASPPEAQTAVRALLSFKNKKGVYKLWEGVNARLEQMASGDQKAKKARP